MTSKNRSKKGQEVIVIKEIEYPAVTDMRIIEQWADGIPKFSENDPKNPEWQSTPIISLDLSGEGYGQVHVKDESDIRSNPTGTIKDRAAWELTTLFRDYARGLWLKSKAGLLAGRKGDIILPRLSYVTAGNVGRAVSTAFEKYNLPPIKLLVDSGIPPERLEMLKRLHADIYLTDLSRRELSPEEIKRLTNNANGIDITSVMSIEPQAVFYDWHVHEAFNEQPDEIYIPYGSGRLMENYLTWQARNMRNKDPRLRIPLEKLVSISILGAEPENADSIADKLTKHHNPFIIFDDQDVFALRILQFTGKDTRVYCVAEDRIKQAYSILRKYCDTEPSAAAGLALYLQRYDQKKVNPGDKILIINTGKGI